MGRSYQLGVVVAAVCVAAAAVFFFATTSIGRPVTTKNLSNAKQLATGCKIYADDHEGRFPLHLSELVPDYIPTASYDGMRCASLGREGDPKIFMDWLYFGAGFTDKNPPTLLIASPQATSTLPAQKRVIIHGDGSGIVLYEADYPPLLAETVRQMQAEDLRRRASSSSPPSAARPLIPARRRSLREFACAMQNPS